MERLKTLFALLFCLSVVYLVLFALGGEESRTGHEWGTTSGGVLVLTVVIGLVSGIAIVLIVRKVADFLSLVVALIYIFWLAVLLAGQANFCDRYGCDYSYNTWTQVYQWVGGFLGGGFVAGLLIGLLIECYDRVKKAFSPAKGT